LTNDATVIRPHGAKVGRFAKFGVVGITGTLVSAAFLYLLGRRLGVALLPAAGIAVELAAISNFLLNSHWTFATSPSALRFAKFNVAFLSGLVVNVLAVGLLTRIGWYLLAADLVGLAAGLVISYVLSAGWVWDRAA
jgi:dolichol-phosphate mannosyltransferase